MSNPETRDYRAEGMIFVTSEKHYRERRLVAEIMEIDDHRTALDGWLSPGLKLREKYCFQGLRILPG